MTNSEAEMGSDAAQVSRGEYQVFLSFRGPDTRYGFTDFLYDYLVDAGVRVFQDNNELQVGEVIGDNLLKAINNSIIYITIFSHTYASSKWCLRELVHIIDNVSRSEGKKNILPIFFHVEPDDVKLRTSLYSNALSEHKEKFPNEVEAWSEALAKVGKIKGWIVEKDQSQPRIVKLVVKRILEELEIKQKSVTEHLVGQDQVEKLRQLLHVEHGDVRLIGIYGMGGIGKTTIAKVIFNQLCSHFGKRCSFLEGIRERSSKEGIVQLQKKLLCDIVDTKSAEEVKDSDGGMRRIGETFPTEKVFVVLDDVDKKEHIMKLIGNSKLRSGSRIIITTRDTTVLEVDGFIGETRQYEMRRMDDGLALQLFCRHAFGTNFPCDVYHKLSSDIVSRMGGLPLAIEVVGSLLKEKKEAFWRETLARLKKEPEEEILKKLKISYDDLDKCQKQIFLDIACFFFNEKKTDAIYMWTDCSFYPERGIDVLTSRCLIKILDNGKFWVHDQLIDLGRQIVREENQGNLEKQSRLWIAKEAIQIIETEERKPEVRGLEIREQFEITNEDFERLPNLRFLDLNWGTYVGDFARCSSNLRWFSWHSPLEKDFRANNLYFDHLVVCKLNAIYFKDDSKAWDLIKWARNLKVLSITCCSGITTIPDISRCSRLERLTIGGCSSLKRIQSFIGNLQSLIELKIEGCSDLIYLPEGIGTLVKLEQLSLSRCTRMRELRGSIGNLTSLTELDLTDTIIRELPNSIGKLKSLRILRFPINSLVDWEDHDWQLPSGISTLVNLEELDLSGHNEIRGEIPVGIGELSSLRILNLESTGICKIPRTISKLHRLQTLNLTSCHEIKELPELPTSLTCLLLKSDLLLSVPNLSNLTNLVELLLSNDDVFGEKSKLFTGCDLRWIKNLSRLKKLELDLLNVPAPPELASLSHLEELVLGHLYLKPLVQLPSSNWSWRNLSSLEIDCCEVEDISLEGLQHLEKFTVKFGVRLQKLSIPLELRKLRKVRVSFCRELVEISGLSYLKNLETLRIEGCKVLTNVEGLDELESLKSLEVISCMSLTWLIDASYSKIPDDCVVNIWMCGDSIKNSGGRMPLKYYREEILLNTSSKDGAKFDISGSEGYSYFASVSESETDGTSSTDDFQPERGNAECFEATRNRRQMRDRRIGHYDNVNRGKTASMENRKKEKNEIGKPTNPNDVVRSSCQRCERVKHYERSCNSTIEVKRDRIVEAVRELAKTGRGSGTGCASNPGRDPAKKCGAKGIASSSRNSKASRLGRDIASTSGKGTTSNFGRGIASSSQSNATLSTRRSRGSTSGKGTTLSSGRATIVSIGTGRNSSSRTGTTKVGGS